MQKFLYIPWVKGQGDALVDHLIRTGHIQGIPLNIHKILPHLPFSGRPYLNRFARSFPEAFKEYFRKALLQIDQPVKGLILTLDWNAPQRLCLEVAHEVGLPTVLIPHESVFADENLYYRCPITNVSTPKALDIIVWGDLQKDIFERRGVHSSSLKKMGSIKLDRYVGFESSLSHSEFANIYHLDESRPIILFCAQPMDIQFGNEKDKKNYSDISKRKAYERTALKAQNKAIEDVIDVCLSNGWQFILRLPPARDKRILSSKILWASRLYRSIVIDGNKDKKKTTPEESLYHSSLVVSLNSTMLLEAGLLNVPSLSMGYIDFNELWHQKGGIPIARNRTELETYMKDLVGSGKHSFSSEGVQWVKKAFSIGLFDGKSCERIVDYLCSAYTKDIFLNQIAII